MAGNRSELEAELRHLKGRVAEIEALLTSSPPTTPASQHPPPAVPVGDYYRWMDEHAELLRSLPDCFVAIDPTLGDEGLVIHEADGEAFNEQLRELYESDPTARERVLTTHSSMC